MNEESLETIESVEGRHAAARSLAYSVFARMFEYPDGEQGEAIRSGALATLLRDALVAVDPAVEEEANWDALRDAGGEDDLPVEFTRLFDVGTGAPPCPLHGGLYVGNRMKTMEEAVRFYNFFGLTLSEAPRELPDHITTQLEFLHFLAFREAQALETGADPGSWRRAERDFVARHPGRWVPGLRKRLEGEEPMPFFRELVARLASFLEAEASYLGRVAADA
jgi:DMSO reductase family type II enzyme chaperone